MSNKRETAFAATLAAIAALLAAATPALTGGVVGAQPYYASPSFFPLLGLTLIVVFGSWSAWQAWRGVRRDLSDEIEAEHTSIRLALGGAVLLGLYVFLCMLAGYAASTFVSLCLLGWWVRLSKKLTVLLAAAVTALLYGAFVFGFKVWFAPGWIEGLWR